jgi:hypothetical protein
LQAPESFRIHGAKNHRVLRLCQRPREDARVEVFKLLQAGNGAVQPGIAQEQKDFFLKRRRVLATA